MNPYVCMHPRFEFLEEPGVWSQCLACGRLAWDHEQADPLADIRNYMQMRFDDGTSRDYPPTMRP